ncbi:PLP-dependent transferase [Mycobacterium lepromatosis]|uniref:PLP-dependent transferase n=1 Tax=Mycobacterium lepromatosis TaxID=480418 RepID=UPI003D807B15
MASSFNAFLLAEGLETLSLQVKWYVVNVQLGAEFLAGRRNNNQGVVFMNYAGLPSSPWHERTRKPAPKGNGAVLSFEMASCTEAGKTFVNALKLHSHVVYIGDVHSLVNHPASSTPGQLTPKAQLYTDVSLGLVRLAVGLESIDDILIDLELGFATVHQSSDPQAMAAF